MINRFTDGEWHRLHPATPLLRGGIALVAIFWIIVTNFRDIFVNQVLGGPENEDDPFAWLLENDLFWIALGGVLVVLALFVAFFYVSWRMHTFRITDEVVEVRSGTVFRTHRKGRLDRIQGINITRPFFARLFGAAKLEVDVAGHDAKVQLAYLGSGAADELRTEILRLASGTQVAAAEATEAPAGSVIEKRVAELLAPELDLAAAPPESIVQLKLGRILGSLLLSNFTIIMVIAIIVFVINGAIAERFFQFFIIVPAVFAMVTFYWSRFSRSMQYSIASTPDGIRVGHGLLTTTNETLPPGRIHAIRVSQPLLWRIPGWWEIDVNKASRSSNESSGGQTRTTILPVGNRDEVLRVLALLLPDFDSPELLENGLLSRGDGYSNSPRRAQVVRLLSWRRNGYAYSSSSVLLRTGSVWRKLTIVPLARLQSVALELGPLRRRLRLATVRLHTVAGPVTPSIGGIDGDEAQAMFARVATEAVAAGSVDTTHRWRSHEKE